MGLHLASRPLGEDSAAYLGLLAPPTEISVMCHGDTWQQTCFQVQVHAHLLHPFNIECLLPFMPS